MLASAAVLSCFGEGYARSEVKHEGVAHLPQVSRHLLGVQTRAVVPGAKRAAQPPVGLMTVAALLPKDWQKRLVDCNVEQLEEGDLAWADVALVSGMHIQREQLISIVSVAAHATCQRS